MNYILMAIQVIGILGKNLPKMMADGKVTIGEMATLVSEIAGVLSLPVAFDFAKQSLAAQEIGVKPGPGLVAQMDAVTTPKKLSEAV